MARPVKILVRRPVLAAVLAALAAALSATTAAAQNGRADQLLSDRPPTRRTCTIATTPRALPALAQLADSAALAAAVADYARKYPISGDRPMFALYSIAFGEHGAVERVKVIDYLLPREREEELAGIVRQALRPQQAPFSVRLRMEPGAAQVFRVGRSERCPPESNLRFELTAPATAPTGTPPSITARTVVGPDGRVRGLQLLRRTGDVELDRWVEDNLARRTYQPGLIDGVPVVMENEETVRIRARP